MVVGLYLVCHRMAASMISIRIPTVGVGCCSLSYLIYGGLSTLPMLMQLLLNWWTGTGKHLVLRVWVRRLSGTLCMLAVGTLVFITFAAVSTGAGLLTSRSFLLSSRRMADVCPVQRRAQKLHVSRRLHRAVH